MAFAFFTRSLSSKLLALTIVFVLLAEVLIFAPSIGRFRLVYFQERLDESYLATLAIDASPDGMVTDMLKQELLSAVGALQILRMEPGQRDTELAALISAEVDQSYDLRDASFMMLIMDALQTMTRSDDRIIEIIGSPTSVPDITLKIRLDEKPLRQQMYDYALRILLLSLFISAMAGIMLFFALRWMLVRPLQNMVKSMMAFREAPESDAGTISQSGRTDEVGIAERELAAMQDNVRQSLRQKTRLALLGTAVAKINHDLRNMLSTAALLSERLTDSNDERVTKVAPRLLASIDRAIELCSETLKFSHDGTLPVRRQVFAVKALIDEIGEEIVTLTPEGQDWYWNNRLPEALELNADREQLYRVIANLSRNAFEAGAVHVTVELAESSVEREVCLDIVDDGPGLPPRARENLFVPFAGSARGGGTGLGLTIAREIVRAHGGNLTLECSDSGGTRFRLHLPNPRQPGSSRATASAANPS
jgi:signal transduction histidine kinase